MLRRGILRGWVALGAMALVASSGCDDEGTAVVEDGGSDDDAGPLDAAPPDAGRDAGSDPERDGGAVDAGAPDASAPDAGALPTWSASFDTGVIDDPEGDDTGDGDYTYPVVGGAPLDGVADLRSFRASYDATTGALTIRVGLTRIDTHTRVAVLLIDRASTAEHAWTIGGVELRVPAWDEHGVQLVLADPDGPLFDFGVIYDLHPFTDVRRPDNVVYTREGFGGAFVSTSGAETIEVASALRVPVTVDRSGDVHVMTATLDAASIARFVDMSASTLQVVAYSYLLIDPGGDMLSRVEFGALEITGELGGFDATVDGDWRDCDVYDLMFVDTPGEQSALLSAPLVPGGSDDTDVVVLDREGAGLLEIDLERL